MATQEQRAQHYPNVSNALTVDGKGSGRYLTKAQQRMASKPEKRDEILKILEAHQHLHLEPKSFTPLLSEVLKEDAPDLMEEWEAYLVELYRGDSRRCSSDQPQAHVSEEVWTAQEAWVEMLWSRGEPPHGLARSILVVEWYKRVLQEFDARFHLLLAIHADVSQMGLSGDLPSGFYNKVTQQLSEPAPDLVKQLERILPPRMIERDFYPQGSAQTQPVG